MSFDLWPLFVAGVLGVVEGVTEFLPVSSTGHLIIANDLLGATGARADTFAIVIQLGAVLAVVWHYRARLLGVAAHLGAQEGREFLLPLLVAFLPAAVIGLLFHDWIKAVLFTPLVVAAALVVGGLVILVLERIHPVDKITDAGRMPIRTALGIGVAQVLALIPGTSRSATTILGGFALGCSRAAATEFSFFLAIPVLGSATLYDLYKSRELFTDAGYFELLVGTVVAFVTALLVIRGFLKFVAGHDFRVFAWYRIGFGLVLAAYYWNR
jgi:undecaprenyl-diphosphatase